MITTIPMISTIPRIPTMPTIPTIPTGKKQKVSEGLFRYLDLGGQGRMFFCFFYYSLRIRPPFIGGCDATRKSRVDSRARRVNLTPHAGRHQGNSTCPPLPYPLSPGPGKWVNLELTRSCPHCGYFPCHFSVPPHPRETCLPTRAPYRCPKNWGGVGACIDCGAGVGCIMGTA